MVCIYVHSWLTSLFLSVFLRAFPFSMSDCVVHSCEGDFCWLMGNARNIISLLSLVAQYSYKIKHFLYLFLSLFVIKIYLTCTYRKQFSHKFYIFLLIQMYYQIIVFQHEIFIWWIFSHHGNNYWQNWSFHYEMQ